MEISNAMRAQVLVTALPYLKEYKNKIVVIKYGGNAMINEDLKQAVMGDVVLLSLVGVKVVLVHGGGPEITDTLKRMNIETRFENGLRVTDKECANVAMMVLSGKINKQLVNLLENTGGKAIGISGIDGHMLEAKKLDEKLGFVGEITAVDTTPIKDLLEKGYIPVVSTVGCDKDGNVYNINADTAAAKIAADLNAESLISMTDICGILRDPNDPSTLIQKINTEEVNELLESGVISGGMIPKVRCCTDAIKDGVKKVFIVDGRVPHSVIVEMLTDEGMGTMFH